MRRPLDVLLDVREEDAPLARLEGQMFPSGHFQQEIARERHADMLRQVRHQRVAAIEQEERERSPLNRLRRLLVRRGLALARLGNRKTPRSVHGSAV